jgi:hypothetical protein
VDPAVAAAKTPLVLAATVSALNHVHADPERQGEHSRVRRLPHPGNHRDHPVHW